MANALSDMRNVLRATPEEALAAIKERGEPGEEELRGVAMPVVPQVEVRGR